MPRNAILAGLVLVGGGLAVAEWLRVVDHGALGADFHNPLWQAGRDILHGKSPYFPPTSPLLANTDPARYPALYPPPLNLALIPLAIQPLWIAYAEWLVVLSASLLGSLWLVGVRDPRCYIIWAVSAAAAATLPQGNATPLLLLAVALMWRYRNRPGTAGWAVAGAAAIKLWPAVLAFWLIRTRRLRAAIASVVGATALILAGWAAISFQGLSDFPAMQRAHAEALAKEGEFVVGLAVIHGSSLAVASAAGLAVSAALLYVAWCVADERVSLAFVLGAGLFATTLGWPQYLMLLIVPIAALSPTFGPLWLFSLVPYGSMLLAYQANGGRISRGLWTTTTTLAMLFVIDFYARKRPPHSISTPAEAYVRPRVQREVGHENDKARAGAAHYPGE
jgi:hypothetical protein